MATIAVEQAARRVAARCERLEKAATAASIAEVLDESNGAGSGRTSGCTWRAAPTRVQTAANAG